MCWWTATGFRPARYNIRPNNTLCGCTPLQVSGSRFFVLSSLSMGRSGYMTSVPLHPCINLVKEKTTDQYVRMGIHPSRQIKCNATYRSDEPCVNESLGSWFRKLQEHADTDRVSAPVRSILASAPPSFRRLICSAMCIPRTSATGVQIFCYRPSRCW